MRTLLTLCFLMILTVACRAEPPVTENTVLGWLPRDLDCVGALRPALLPTDVTNERSRAPALVSPLLLLRALDQRARMHAVAFGARRSEGFTHQCCIVVGDDALTYESLDTLGSFPPEKGLGNKPVLHTCPRRGLVLMSTDPAMLEEMSRRIGTAAPDAIPEMVRADAGAWVVGKEHHLQMVSVGQQAWRIYVDPASCTNPELKAMSKIAASGDLCFGDVCGEPAVVLTAIFASELMGYPFDLPDVPAPH